MFRLAFRLKQKRNSRKSSSNQGRDNWLTLQLNLGNLRLLILTLSLEYTFCPLFPLWELFSRTS